jgi:CRP-like cAMP-binding protein
MYPVGGRDTDIAIVVSWCGSATGDFLGMRERGELGWGKIPPERAARSHADGQNPTFHDRLNNRLPRLLWGKTRQYGPGAQVITEFEFGLEQPQVIASGWACDMRILSDGRRQIFAFLIPGDPIVTTSGRSNGPYAVVALTQLVVVAQAPKDDEADAPSPIEALVAAQRQVQLYDQLVRIGQLSARERIAHLLLELFERLDRVGLVKDNAFKVPVNQEVLADALGMSVVHINRTLREMRDDNLLKIKASVVTLKNLPQLIAISGYSTAR